MPHATTPRSGTKDTRYCFQWLLFRLLHVIRKLTPIWRQPAEVDGLDSLCSSTVIISALGVINITLIISSGILLKSEAVSCQYWAHKHKGTKDSNSPFYCKTVHLAPCIGTQRVIVYLQADEVRWHQMNILVLGLILTVIFGCALCVRVMVGRR